MACADALPDAAIKNLSKIGDANRFVYYDDYKYYYYIRDHVELLHL